jgi:hypothetical protein
MSLSNCNHTELYQMCIRADLLVSPSSSRELMIQILEGERGESPELTERNHSVHSWRFGIMGFLLDYWKQLETQITCPARSKDPRSCFGCIDTQVISCVVQNEENEKLIELHRGVKEE